MRRTAFLFLLLFAACATVPARDYTTAIAESAAQIEATVAGAKIPGAAVAVTVGDNIVWHDTFGSGITAETRFRIGSVTKLLTAAALMRLVDQGKLSLDDRVSKYLPDVPNGTMTLRQLAGHLGGIRHYGPTEFIGTRHFESATAALPLFINDALIARPGERFFYSSHGYTLIAAVIEKVTGKRFPEAVRALVSLRETSFVDAPKTSGFFAKNSKGEIEATPQVDLSDRLAGGGALSTARDLARFLIDAKYYPEMLISQTTPDGRPTGTGIAWRIAQDEKGRTFLHHGGQAMGGRAFVLVYPKERVGVVFLSNLSFAPFNEKDAGAIAARFLN